jgi:hypothetical protein
MVAMAEQEAIREIADTLFSHLGEHTQDFEVQIGPHDIVNMLNVTLTSLEGRSLLRDRVNITPPDIARIVGDYVDLFNRASLIEREE